jgi:hypothetical protein
VPLAPLEPASSNDKYDEVIAIDGLEDELLVAPSEGEEDSEEVEPMEDDQ